MFLGLLWIIYCSDHEAEEAEAQPSQQDEMDWAADDEAAKFLGHDE